MSEDSIMKCRDEKCVDGIVDLNRNVRFKTRCCCGYGIGHPCTKCGLLHSSEGEVVTQGEKWVFVEDGNKVILKEMGKEKVIG